MITKCEVDFTNQNDIKHYIFPPGTILRKRGKNNKILCIYEVNKNGEIREVIKDYQEMVRPATREELLSVQNIKPKEAMSKWVVPTIVDYIINEGAPNPEFPNWKKEVADCIVSEFEVFESFCLLEDDTLYTYYDVFNSTIENGGVATDTIIKEFTLYIRHLVREYTRRSRKHPRYISIPFSDKYDEVRLDTKTNLWRIGRKTETKWLPLKELVKQERERRRGFQL
jgi:hypothetical protein